MGSILAELQRRNVYRVAFAYLILGWLVLQITDVVAPALHLPEWTITLVTFLGIIGFPFAMFFTWAFEMTPQGLKRSGEVERDESITHHTGSKINKLIISMMALAILLLLADRFYTGHTDTAASAAGGEMAEAAVARSTDTAASGDDKPRSIAVLPFVNMSKDPDQEFFSDGISEELLNGLARIRELRVAARTSSFAFKGMNQDIGEIGAKLNVATVLEGSVRKSGQHLRITAQLINVEDGFHLWSETYDRDLTDIFVIQDEISAAIVDALRVHLGTAETNAPRAVVASNDAVQGYEYFLQARHALRERTPESIERALALYRQSLALSPNYAPARAGEAQALYFQGDSQYGTLPQAEANRAAASSAQAALAIDANEAYAEGVLGLIAMEAMDNSAALAHFDRALASNPSLGIVHSWRARALKTSGRNAEARAAAELAYQLDPLHPVSQNNLLMNYIISGDLAGGEKFYRSLSEPREWVVERAYVQLLRARGEYAAGYQRLQQAITDMSDQSGSKPLNDFRFDWLHDTVLPDSLSAADRWWYMTRTLPAEQIVALAPLLGRDDQQLAFVRNTSAQALFELGRNDEALALLAQRSAAQRQPAITRNEASSDAFDDMVLEAAIEKAHGRQAQANAITDPWINFYQQAAVNGMVGRDYDWARLFALRDDNDKALQALQAQLAAYDLAWYTARSPAFVNLRQDLRWQAIYTKLASHINAERTKLGWPPLETTP